MMSIVKKHFGSMDDGREVSTYTLMNASGMKVKITDFGGAIMELYAPDRDGRMTDVVLGFTNLDDYKKASGYHGALVGRVGNRICRGKYTLDGKEYSLYINNGLNSLHGGEIGFSKKLWEATPLDGTEPKLVLKYVSPDMEENYPGALSVTVTYTLTSDNALSIHYEAETDKKTIVNLTNHVYFNLSGYASGSILDHVLWLDCDSYTPTDKTLIPTGEIKSVEGTPFDFREEKEVGRDMDMNDTDIGIAGGFDHNMNFSGGETKEVVLRGKLYDAKSGREMELYTNQPCVQFYTGNFLNGTVPFKGGYPQQLRHGMALETQKMPDSINHPNFTSIVLDKGEKYDYTTIYKFGVR